MFALCIYDTECPLKLKRGKQSLPPNKQINKQQQNHHKTKQKNHQFLPVTLVLFKSLKKTKTSPPFTFKPFLLILLGVRMCNVLTANKPEIYYRCKELKALNHCPFLDLQARPFSLQGVSGINSLGLPHASRAEVKLTSLGFAGDIHSSAG